MEFGSESHAEQFPTHYQGVINHIKQRSTTPKLENFSGEFAECFCKRSLGCWFPGFSRSGFSCVNLPMRTLRRNIPPKKQELQFPFPLRRWFWVALWVGLVCLASTGAGSQEVSARLLGPVLLWLYPGLSLWEATQAHFLLRKIAHVGQFFIFALLCWHAICKRPAWKISPLRLAAVILSVSLLLAGMSEGMQFFFVERAASWMDVGFDFLGAVLGTALAWSLALAARIWHSRPRAPGGRFGR